MKKLQRIVLGWWFYLTNQHNYLAQQRLEICAKCIHRKWVVCGLCGCALQAKARLMEDECPADKWPPVMKKAL